MKIDFLTLKGLICCKINLSGGQKARGLSALHNYLLFYLNTSQYLWPERCIRGLLFCF